jgi:tetratricopeptide (TPR) repeat protein
VPPADEPASDETLAATGSADRRDAKVERARLARGMPVGRYVIVGELGAGAMGVVYAAYDPELDRKVALKLLAAHPSSAIGETSPTRLRFLREARAMAKLNHPHVVSIHDVGEHDDEVFIAMELVHGRTLARWVAEDAPAWPRIIDVFVSAGRGLLAAHAEGLVHRDFKPDNLMIGDDGRVRVMDFGLARSEVRLDTQSNEGDRAVSGSDAPHEALLTQIGAMVGTPAYMAPEQFRGRGIGPPADQFAFCVSLWEALHGRRPFAGETPLDIAMNVLEGAIVEPGATRVPAWIRRVLERGLSPSPGDRWPGLAELLDALQRGRSRARGRRILLGLTAAGALGLGALGWQRFELDRRRAACENEGAEIASVWNDERRADVRGGLTAGSVSYAEATADAVMPWLDQYAAAWHETRSQACIDARVRGELGDDGLERVSWCLDERRMELDAFAAALAEGGDLAVRHAVQGAAGLRLVAPCRDEALLPNLPLPPPQERTAVRDIRADLSRAVALHAMGRYTDGLEPARRALASAEALAWPPLVATARGWVGRLHERSGEYAEAERVLETAYFEAAAAHADDVALDLAEALVYTVGDRLSRHDDGLRWSRHAEVHLADLPDVAHTRRADHLTYAANLHAAKGEHALARSMHEEALALKEESLGREHPHVAAGLNDLALVVSTMGDHGEARAMHERALAIREKVLGAEHPDVAMSLHNLANVHQATSRLDEAKSLLERAAAIHERALGPDHPHLASSLAKLAETERMLGAFDDALTRLDRVLSIREASLGARHPQVGTTHASRAQVHLMRGDFGKARADYERALEILEAAHGPESLDVAGIVEDIASLDVHEGKSERARAGFERVLAVRLRVLGPVHAKVGATLLNLATASYGLGDLAAAKTGYAEAVDVLQKALGPDHLHVAMGLGNLAETMLRLGEIDEAEVRYRRALEIHEAVLGADNPTVAYSLVGLGKIELRRGRPAEALELATRAVHLREQEGVQPIDLAEARFLLARAQWEADAPRAAARDLAESADAVYRASLDAEHPDRVAIEEWLAAHAGER